MCSGTAVDHCLATATEVDDNQLRAEVTLTCLGPNPVDTKEVATLVGMTRLAEMV